MRGTIARQLGVLAVAALLLGFLPGSLSGQATRGGFGGGISLSAALPQQEFSRFADSGWGAGLFLLWTTDGPVGLGLRLEGLLVDYGGDRWTYWSRGRFASRPVQVGIDHLIFAGLFGPELDLRAGPFRAYVNGGLGPAYFVTTGNGRPWDWHYGGHRLGGSILVDDLTTAFAGGGGLWIRMFGPVYLTLSTRYVRFARVTYASETTTFTDERGFAQVTPTESDVDLLLFEIGVSGLTGWLR